MQRNIGNESLEYYEGVLVELNDIENDRKVVGDKLGEILLQGSIDDFNNKIANLNQK